VRERDKKAMKNRILIVDDEDDINVLFKKVLEDNGYKVDTFNDPLVALQNFTAGSYDLLLLDIVRIRGIDTSKEY
jgi:DNA-binding response OmpR family regulator